MGMVIWLASEGSRRAGWTSEEAVKGVVNVGVEGDVRDIIWE